MSILTESTDRWFRGKVAIVTGAGLGIGKGIAEALLDAGTSVILNGRSQERMESVVGALPKYDGTAIAAGGDASSPEDSARLVEEAVRRFGRLDFLVNSAGVRIPGRVASLPLTDWNAVIDVQLTATYVCCHAAIDPLVETGSGRIVNLSSMFGFAGRPDGSPYAAAKLGVVSFTKVLASELAPFVTVNAVAPGFIETERFVPDLSPAARDKVRQERAGEIAMARVGKPEDIAAAAMYLLGPGASWVTGQVLHVNGGRLMP